MMNLEKKRKICLAGSETVRVPDDTVVDFLKGLLIDNR